MTPQVLRTLAEVKAWAADLRRSGRRLALVPTMGYLHEGHLSLMREGRRHADVVATSIFVNPTQFGPKEDLARYPRDMEGDLAKCGSAGVDVVFAPEAGAMYPPGYQTYVEVTEVSKGLCGERRPGHFRGVATIVTQLLCLFRPEVALFGEKDYQQLTVIRRVVEDLNVPVKIVGAPTVRAEDGLALSSRNRYLSAKERAIAPSLYRALDRARRRLEAGDIDLAGIEADGLTALADAGIRPDYFEVRTADRLARPVGADLSLVVLAAGRLGRARLIDNLQCRSPAQLS